MNSVSHGAEAMEEVLANPHWRSRPEWRYAKELAQRLAVEYEAACQQLEVLYPPDVCRKMASDADTCRPLIPLFYPGLTFPLSDMLLMGADLALCEGWEANPQLRAELQREGPASDFRLEIGLWAGMRRVGLAVRYEPRTAGATRCDLIVLEDELSIALEAKRLAPAQAHLNAQTLELVLSHQLVFSGQTSLPAHCVRLIADADLIECVEGTRPADFEPIAEQFAARVARWYRDSLRSIKPGIEAKLAGIGTVRIETSESDDLWSQQIDGLPKRGISHYVFRALHRLRRRAAKQVSAHNVELRAAVIWMPAWYTRNPETLETLAHQISEHKADYHCFDAIFLLYSHRLDGVPSKTEVAGLELSWSHRSIRDMTWPQGLVRWKQSM